MTSPQTTFRDLLRVWIAGRSTPEAAEEASMSRQAMWSLLTGRCLPSAASMPEWAARFGLDDEQLWAVVGREMQARSEATTCH